MLPFENLLDLPRLYRVLWLSLGFYIKPSVLKTISTCPCTPPLALPPSPSTDLPHGTCSQSSSYPDNPPDAVTYSQTYHFAHFYYTVVSSHECYNTTLLPTR